MELFERNDDARGAATARINLGAAHYDRGDWDLAAESYGLAGSDAERIGDLVLAATARNNLAEILSDRGDLVAVEPLFEEALSSWQTFDYPIGVGVALGNLGRLRRRDGRFDAARADLVAARTEFEALDARDFVAEVDLRRAELELASGALDAAAIALDSCDDAVRTGEAGGALAVATLRLRAVLAHRRGDHDQAEELFRQAVDIARRQGLGYELALTDDRDRPDHRRHGAGPPSHHRHRAAPAAGLTSDVRDSTARTGTGRAPGSPSSNPTTSSHRR